MLYFYYPANVDYMGYLDDYQNIDEYSVCKIKCKSGLGDELRGSAHKEYKTCLKDCRVEANNENKIIAKLTTASNGKDLTGIIYTIVSKTEINADNLMLVTSVNTTTLPKEIKYVDVLLSDLFAPNSRLNGKTLCSNISEATNQTLSAVSYMVNGSPNPRFVEAECIDIHSKIYLGDKISRSADRVMKLMDDSEYTSYCIKDNKQSCEKVLPWMKGSATENPASICSWKSGFLGTNFNATCEVNDVQRDKIKVYLRGKINKCIGEMGCLTDTAGEQGKFKRLHTVNNFKKSVPTQICCKRSLSAVIKGVMRMERLYKYVGNLSYDEQMDLISKSAMSDDEKKIFIAGVQDSHNISENLVKNLNIDRPTQILMESFSIIVRNALKSEFRQFAELNKELGEFKTDKAAESKLDEITGDKDKSGYLMSLLKSAASGVVGALVNVAKYLWKTIVYFAKKSFDLLTWIFHHPTTAMWLAYSALYLKKKCCEMISLRMYTSPEIIEVGLFGKGADIFKDSKDYAMEIGTFFKKTFLTKAYDFIGSTTFGGYISTLGELIETGILYVIRLIPVVGIPIALTIEMSGGLTVVMAGLVHIMNEAMYYGMTALVLKETGGDIYAIITGSCIKPPEAIKSMTLKGILAEGASILAAGKDASGTILSTSVSAVSIAAEKTNGFFNHIYSLMPEVIVSTDKIEVMQPGTSTSTQ